MQAIARTHAATRAPAHKQALLIEAATDLFARQGFEETSTLQIAQHAGVSEGILFHHFGSKLGLLKAVAQQFARDSAAQAFPETSLTADAPRMTEEEVVRRTFDFADANPELYALLCRFEHVLNEDGQPRQKDLIVREIRDGLLRAIAQGQVPDCDVDIMAELQYGLVDSAYRTWRRDSRPHRRDIIIKVTARCMRAILAAEQAEPRHNDA